MRPRFFFFVVAGGGRGRVQLGEHLAQVGRVSGRQLGLGLLQAEGQAVGLSLALLQALPESVGLAAEAVGLLEVGRGRLLALEHQRLGRVALTGRLLFGPLAAHGEAGHLAQLLADGLLEALGLGPLDGLLGQGREQLRGQFDDAPGQRLRHPR